MRGGKVFPAVLLAVLLIGVRTPAEAQKRNLAMGSTSTSSSHYAYFVGAAKAINLLAPEVNVAVVETGGVVDNLKRMQKGQIDLGLVAVDQVYLAWKGQENWKATPFEDIRMAWVYSVSAHYLIVREESGVKDIAELSGKKFNPGLRGGVTEKTFEAVLGDLGIKPEWQRMGLADAVDAMKDKRIVGYGKAGAGFNLDGSTLDIATQTPIRVLPFSDEHMRKSKAARPYLPWVKVPAGSIQGMGEFWTPGGVSGVGVPKSMPDEVVYKLAKAIWEGQEHQPQAVMGVAYRNPRLTLEQSLSPLHAGALKYYREMGFKVPSHLVPPEAR